MRQVMAWDLPTTDLWQRVLWGFRAPGAYTSSTHLLSSGDEARFYVDFDLIVRDPTRADEVVRLYAEAITAVKYVDPIHLLGFIEKDGNTVGALSGALALSILTQLPHVVVRLRKQAMSERLKLKSGSGLEIGRRLEGRNVALVCDHATRGTELTLAAESVAFFGGKVTRIFLFSVRADKFEWDEFKSKGITIHARYRVPDDLEAAGIHPQKLVTGRVG